MADDRPKQRRGDRSTIARIWHESSPWVHIITLAFMIGIAYQATAGSVGQNTKNIEDNTARIKKVEEAMAAQVAISARIEQKVDYIREDVKDIKKEQR